MNAKRPVLVFDFGNVVAFFDYSRACEDFGARVGLSGSVFYQRLQERGIKPLALEYERGGMTSAQFAAEVARLAECDFPFDDFATAWSNIFWLNEPVARIAAQLKHRGYPLLLGSNTSELHANHFRRAFQQALSVFDPLILSYEIGHLKPSQEFYHACAAAANAAPEECVFIDDMPENVEGARRAGLQGVLYRDPASLIAALGELGVEVAGLQAS